MRVGRETLCLIGFGFLQFAVMDYLGTITADPLLFIVVAAVPLLVALRRPLPDTSAGWRPAAIVAGLPTLLNWGKFGSISSEAFLVVSLSATTASLYVRRPRVARGMLAVAGLSLLGSAVVIWHWGRSEIDVWDALQAAGTAIIHGHNPYGPTLRFTAQVSPHVDQAGHFQYGPLMAFLAAPGALLGDARLLAPAATGLLYWSICRVGRGNPRRSQRQILALCLLSSFALGMVHFAWVDVYVMAGFTGWLALREQHPRLGILCVAAALAIKPIVLLPLAPFFFWSQRVRVECVLATAASLLFMLPFIVVTGPRAFFQDLIGIQLDFPVRTDSLALNGYLERVHGVSVPVWASALAITAAFLVCTAKRPADLGDLSLQAAAFSLIALFFAKWAFFNYYYITDVLLLLAVAGIGVGWPQQDLVRPTPRTILTLQPWTAVLLGRRQAALDPGAAAGQMHCDAVHWDNAAVS